MLHDMREIYMRRQNPGFDYDALPYLIAVALISAWAGALAMLVCLRFASMAIGAGEALALYGP